MSIPYSLHVKEFFATKDRLLFIYENIDDFGSSLDVVRELFENTYHILSSDISQFNYHFIECHYRDTLRAVERYESTIPVRLYKKMSALKSAQYTIPAQYPIPGPLRSSYSPVTACTVSNDHPAPYSSSGERHRCNYARPVKPCTLCSARHRLWHCSMFREMSVFERLNHVNRYGLCHNCFLNTHATVKCGKNARCFVNGCNAKHSMWVHVDPPYDRDINAGSHCPSDQSDVSSECTTEHETLSHTLVSHADCDQSLSQSSVRSAQMSPLSNTHVMSHEDKAMQSTSDDQSYTPRPTPVCLSKSCSVLCKLILMVL